MAARKRGITDQEIGLIKAMLARDVRNRDIQFYFNRQNRPVNSGRITQIRNGTYGTDIASASEADLDTFLATFKAADVGVVIQAQVAPAPLMPPDIAKALFGKGADGRWRLKSGETDEHECKKDFDAKKLSPVLRAIAALSNNRGGFVFLGVSNGECLAEGVCDDFETFDIAKVLDKAKTYLSPTPRISGKGTVDLDGTKVGFIHVASHPDKPVIVCRDDGDKLNEGEILFRYAGQSARIKFGDLRSMLAERDRRSRMALAEAAGKLATVGTGKALILDIDRNVLDADGHEILIDEELAKNINFIREGQFDEVSGGPTLKLIGEVKPVNANSLGADKMVPKAISQEDILTVFLNQEPTSLPMQYVLAGVSQPRLWLPVFYFVGHSSRTPEEVAGEVVKIVTSQKGKKQNVVDRLLGKKTAYTRGVTQKARAISDQVSSGELHAPTTVEDVAAFAQGITGVTNTRASLQDFLCALIKCRELATVADDGNALGAVFKAACRVDEIFFRPVIPAQGDLDSARRTRSRLAAMIGEGGVEG